MMDIRTGIGYDMHRVVAGRPLLLGGVSIPAPFGLEGHSDADCLLHALCDALLGAIGADDIGTLFPDSDPRYAGAPSTHFVAHVMELVRAGGFRVSNADCVIMAERPHLGALKPSLRESIARLLDLPIERVAVKAKSGERVGTIGRGEAIAAIATVLVTRE